MIFIVIFAVTLYLAIGGILGGLFYDYLDDDTWLWDAAWPLLLLMMTTIGVMRLISLIPNPFRKLGYYIRSKFEVKSK